MTRIREPEAEANRARCEMLIRSWHSAASDAARLPRSPTIGLHRNAGDCEVLVQVVQSIIAGRPPSGLAGFGNPKRLADITLRLKDNLAEVVDLILYGADMTGPDGAVVNVRPAPPTVIGFVLGFCAPDPRFRNIRPLLRH